MFHRCLIIFYIFWLISFPCCLSDCNIRETECDKFCNSDESEIPNSKEECSFWKGTYKRKCQENCNGDISGAHVGIGIHEIDGDDLSTLNHINETQFIGLILVVGLLACNTWIAFACCYKKTIAQLNLKDASKYMIEESDPSDCGFDF